MREKSPINYNVVVFYGIQKESIQWQELYEFALNFIESHNQKPSRMTLTGEQVKPSSKTKSFKHYNKIITALEFNGIDGFWIGAGYPENPGGDQDDCFIGFYVDCHYGKELFLYFRNELLGYDADLLKKIAVNLSCNTESQFGAAFQINQRLKDPSRYVSAILSDGDNQEMEENILNWDRAYNDKESYKTGDLRDLYPLNFISETHLQRDVFGQSLRQWIESDLVRGTLEPLNGALWTWEIPQENISDLRLQLKDTDILVCFRPYE